MAQIRITLDGKQAGRKFVVNMQRNKERVNKAISEAAVKVATDIIDQGRVDMRAGGHFGSERWQKGLHALVGQGGGNTRIRILHDVPYWRVFEYGATIHGKPLLWIPLSFAHDAKGIRARNYPGQLFRVDRKSGGAPLLLTPPGIPKYFGKASVTIPKKWHLIQIAARVSRDFHKYYQAAFKSGT